MSSWDQIREWLWGVSIWLTDKLRPRWIAPRVDPDHADPDEEEINHLRLSPAQQRAADQAAEADYRDFHIDDDPPLCLSA